MKPDTAEQPNPNDRILNLRPEVQMFANEMERKLRQNDCVKEGWSGTSRMFLLLRMEEELIEFKSCLTADSSYQQVIGEAADVANFLMMICDRLLDD